MRGIVACGWFGIQTWVGGAAIYATTAVMLGFDPSQRVPLPILGISAGEFACFGNPFISALALVTLAVTTLSTNIAANVVSPANDAVEGKK